MRVIKCTHVYIISVSRHRRVVTNKSVHSLEVQKSSNFRSKNWIGWIEDRWRVEKKKGGKDKIDETSFSQLMKPGIALQLKTDGEGRRDLFPRFPQRRAASPIRETITAMTNALKIHFHA